MPHDYTPEQLRDIYRLVPEDIQEAIFSIDTTEKIQTIGKKYNLHIDQVGSLAHQVGLLMLGITKPNHFINEIALDMHITPQKASEVAQEVNEQIFKPIRESLKKIHGLDGSPPLTASVPSSPRGDQTHYSKTESLLPKNDDPLIQYLSTSNNSTKTSTPTSQSYTHDPYREPIEWD